jgi:hypothetical protein
LAIRLLGSGEAGSDYSSSLFGSAIQGVAVGLNRFERGRFAQDYTMKTCRPILVLLAFTVLALQPTELSAGPKTTEYSGTIEKLKVEMRLTIS